MDADARAAVFSGPGETRSTKREAEATKARLLESGDYEFFSAELAQVCIEIAHAAVLAQFVHCALLNLSDAFSGKSENFARLFK